MVTLQSSRDIADRHRYRVMDMLQYAFKVAANSRNGIFAFRSYNTYSPNLAVSITQIGVCVLNSIISIYSTMGCMPIYGDTDSVMYVIPRSTDGNNELLSSWVDFLMDRDVQGVARLTEIEACNLLSADAPLYIMDKKGIKVYIL